METTTNDAARKGLTIKRLLHVPIDLVWEVWTKPDYIAQWWGPNGFTTTIHSMDVTAGGEWRLTMQGPDGKTYPNRSEFLEIIPLKKLVFKHFNPNYTATIVFEPKDKDTTIEWTTEFDTVELFETVVKVFKADEGLVQNLDKLENYLKQKIQ